MDVSTRSKTNGLDSSKGKGSDSLKRSGSNEFDEISGHLYKRRGGFGKHMPNAWQSRFFSIRDGILFYYEGGDDYKQPRGKVDLKAEGVLVSTGVPFEGAPTPYTIQLCPSGWEEKWKLCAETSDDMDRWVAIIEKHINDNAKRAPPALTLKDYTSDDEGVESIPRSPRSSGKHVEEKTPQKSDAPTEVASPSVATPSAHKSDPIPADPRKPRRRGLKLKNTSADSDLIELTLTLLLTNTCFYFAYTATSIVGSIFYFSIANIVVFHTLSLRSQRAASSENALKQAEATVQSLKESASAMAASLVNGEVPAPAETTEAAANLLPLVAKKPVPGSTLPQVYTQPPQIPPDHTWQPCDHRTFNVRVGPDYNRNKKKGPSGPPIYEPFAVDVFCAKKRIDHVARLMDLPDTSHINTHNEHVPPIMVIQIQIPSEAPPLIGTVEDGPGWAIVMYFKISDYACEELKDLSTASPAVKLFAEYCKRAPTEPEWRARFKVINYCSNLEEMGMPSVIVSYNAKPVLIRRTGSITRGPNYLEVDIHVHKFANLAKKSIHALSSRCGLMYMQIGFVVEGREDSELPETLFACVAVNRPQEDMAEFLFDQPDDDSV